MSQFTHDDLAEMIVRRLDAEIAEVTDKVVRGDAKDYTQYKEMTARISTLNRGREIVIEEHKKFSQDGMEDDDDV